MSTAVGRRGPREGCIVQRQVDRWTAAAFDRRTHDSQRGRQHALRSDQHSGSCWQALRTA
jgi:hypothetical protein